MSNFKPQATFTTDENIREYRNGMSKSRNTINVFPTYRKLRAALKAMLLASHDERVEVSRSKRGEWGEWFEVWEMVNGKPKITKQTWL